MVQDKKNFSAGIKKPMAQDLDRKTTERSPDRSADTARTGNGNMKQADLKDKSAVTGKRDTNSRK